MILTDHLDHPVCWDPHTVPALVDQLQRLIVAKLLERGEG